MSDLIHRLRKRAEIRRQIPSRKSVQEGQPDRLADLLDEAADELEAAYAEIRKQVFGSNVLFDRGVVNRAEEHE